MSLKVVELVKEAVRMDCAVMFYFSYTCHVKKKLKKCHETKTIIIIYTFTVQLYNLIYTLRYSSYTELALHHRVAQLLKIQMAKKTKKKRNPKKHRQYCKVQGS